MIYLVSLKKKQAIAYTGKRHYMSVRAACHYFADDAIALDVRGDRYEAGDVLKVRSGGTTQMSMTERELIDTAHHE